MKYFKDEKSVVWAYTADGSEDAFIPGTLIAITKTEADAIRNPPKTQAELDKEVSDLAKANLAQLRADTYPDVLSFLATLPGATKPIKDAALVAATEKAKVKPKP